MFFKIQLEGYYVAKSTTYKTNPIGNFLGMSSSQSSKGNVTFLWTSGIRTEFGNRKTFCYLREYQSIYLSFHRIMVEWQRASHWQLLSSKTLCFSRRLACQMTQTSLLQNKRKSAKVYYLILRKSHVPKQSCTRTKCWERIPTSHPILSWPQTVPTLLANMLVRFALNTTCCANMLGVGKCWPTFLNMFKNVGQHPANICMLARFAVCCGLLARVLDEQRKPCQHVGSMLVNMLANMLARFAASFRKSSIISSIWYMCEVWVAVEGGGSGIIPQGWKLEIMPNGETPV